MLPTRRIPHTDLHVSAICYGAMPYGTIAQGESMERLFDGFRAAGGNFFDTAHCYAFWLPNGIGASEQALGDIVRRRGMRDQVVIASKGGHPDGGENYRRPDCYMSPERVQRDIDESLARLGMEYIDLYYLHRDDPRLPVSEIIEMLNEEIRRGRIRYLGASNWPTTRIAEANAYAAAHGLQGFAVSQPEWNLASLNYAMDTDPTTRYLTAEDLAWHQEHGFPIVAYSSTACGYFADSNHLRTQAVYDNETNRQRRERARQLANEKGCSANQIALAYLLCQPMLTIPIIGTVHPDHLADALGATDVRLSEKELRWLITTE